MQNAPLRITIHRHALVENEAARLLGRTSRRSSSSGTAGETARSAAVTAALVTAAGKSLRYTSIRWTGSRLVPAGACLPARPQLRLDSSTLFALNAPHVTGSSPRQYSTAAAQSAIHLSLRQGSSALAGSRTASVGSRTGARRQQHTGTAHDKADAEDDRLLPHGRSSRSRGPDAAQINRVSLA
jgi:hypothetical protein